LVFKILDNRLKKLKKIKMNINNKLETRWWYTINNYTSPSFLIRRLCFWILHRWMFM